MSNEYLIATTNKEQCFFKFFNKIKQNKFLILLFCIFFVMCLMFPYTGDDWAWGTNIGLERLETFFENYNGRYAGNLLVLLVTRNKFIRALIESTSFTLIVKLIEMITSQNTHRQYSNIILSIILLAIMPITIFRQTITWASGFANYVLPIIFILYFIYKNKYLIDDSNYSAICSKKDIILFLLIGFITSLFIENLTIYNLLLSISLILYEKLKFKKYNLRNIFYATGSFIGTITMFSNGAYTNIMNNSDTYRTIQHSNIIFNALKTYVCDISNYIFIDNIILYIILSILLLCLINKKSNSNNKTRLFALLNNSSIVIVLLFLVNIIYTNLPNNSSIFLTNKYTLLYSTILGILFSIAYLYIITTCISNSLYKKKLLFYFFSIIAMNLPLLIISPIGPRLFLSTYIFIILIIQDLLNALKFDTDKFLKYLKVICLILILYLFLIYFNIFMVNCKRETYILDFNSKSSTTNNLELPALPYEEYLHGANPTDETFQYRFKNFYGIDQSVEINFYTN